MVHGMGENLGFNPSVYTDRFINKISYKFRVSLNEKITEDFFLQANYHKNFGYKENGINFH